MKTLLTLLVLITTNTCIAQRKGVNNIQLLLLKSYVNVIPSNLYHLEKDKHIKLDIISHKTLMESDTSITNYIKEEAIPFTEFCLISIDSITNCVNTDFDGLNTLVIDLEHTSLDSALLKIRITYSEPDTLSNEFEILLKDFLIAKQLIINDKYYIKLISEKIMTKSEYKKSSPKPIRIQR